MRLLSYNFCKKNQNGTNGQSSKQTKQIFAGKLELLDYLNGQKYYERKNGKEKMGKKKWERKNGKEVFGNKIKKDRIA